MDGDCSHKIKRCLLLWKESYDKPRQCIKKQGCHFVKKKVWIVRAMVFPVVTYRCQSWTIKKAESQRIDVFKCGAGEDS